MIMRRSLIPLALLLVAFATPALSQSASLANPAALREQAPAQYKAKFDTTKGVFVLDVQRNWAPNGADRFYNLVKNGFYDNVRFFRVISGFMVQFGISGDPKISAPWRDAQDQGRSGRAEQPARLHHLRDGRARTRAPPRCSSTSARTAASTARASRRSAASSRAWRWSTSSTPNTAKAPRAAAVPTRAASRWKATPI